MMFRDCIKFTPLPLLPQLEGFQDHIQTPAMTTLNDKKRGGEIHFIRENFVSEERSN